MAGEAVERREFALGGAPFARQPRCGELEIGFERIDIGGKFGGNKEKLRKRNLPDGLLFLIYLSLYSLERFLLAFTSSYQVVAFGLTQSQIVALIGLAVALPLILWTRVHAIKAVPAS